MTNVRIRKSAAKVVFAPVAVFNGTTTPTFTIAVLTILNRHHVAGSLKKYRPGSKPADAFSSFRAALSNSL